MSVSTPELESMERAAAFTAPAAPESVALARRATIAVLDAWACPVDRDVAVLLVDEVFTNAVLHGVVGSPEGARVTVEFVSSSDGLHVEVHDPTQGAGGRLTACHAGAHSECGRGLDLVEALSARWGSKDTPNGKFVYFDIPVSSADAEAAEASELCL